MKKIKYVFTIIVLSLLWIPSLAEATGEMSYSVKANIPENQVDKSKTYFDLRMNPGQKQTISLMLTNTSEEETRISIATNRATTNRNGVIDYSKTEEVVDDSLRYNFTELIEGPESVTLAPNEEKNVEYTIQMPEESFDGIILGGFYLHKETTGNTQEDEGVQIKNDFSYVIGVRLSENDKTIEPKLLVNQITPGLENYRTVVNVNLQNPEPRILSGVTVDAQVRKVGSQTILHQTIKENQSFAPNSNYDFPISWDNQELKPGKYQLSLEATDQEGNKWQFDKEFDIASDVKEINKEAVEIVKETPIWYYVVGILLLVVLVIALTLAVNYWLQKRKQQ